MSDDRQSAAGAGTPFGRKVGAELADRVAITDVLSGYSAAIRLRELERLGSVFTADAVVDYRSIGGGRAGVAETTAFIRSALAGTTYFEHVVSNVTFAFAPDRRSARVVSEWHSVYVPAAGGRALLGYGSYVDTFLSADRWRIAERVVGSDMQARFPVA